ncbi:hypothetical protein NDR87_18725 [Nocardia sp. CDC159]|uniref:Uncharacterized protein n=1 Tax=Nocardia pulmonis TaxID=2951408 RepID=A0A9X2IZP5_9NOCA|nr:MULTISPECIES: hypothetical protein [Nocardia]MCM6776275.1 hypothetical protein [Nocardia pulmonis]MCM6788399.1 hypothetical protein [Nocardia sp. CDC159]
MTTNLPAMHYIITFSWPGNTATCEGIAHEMRTRQEAYRLISEGARKQLNVPSNAAISFFALEPNEIAREET